MIRTLLPGGYISFLVMKKLPGIPLTYDFYWKDLQQEERYKICQAFKQAWM
jgi:hypothetical protein